MTTKEGWAMVRNTILTVGTIAVLGGIHLATLRAGHEWGDDFSLYVAHARNLAEGRPYADTGYVYNPQNAVVSPRSYPPIFPLLLAPVYHFFGLDLTIMKAFEVLLFMVVLGVLAVVFRQRLPLPYALVCLVLFALNPYVWQHKDRLLSETPFMLFAYLALLLAEKGLEADGSRRRSLAWGLLAGLVAYLAFGTRTVGVVLIPTILGLELLRRRRLGMASLAILAAFAAGVGVQKALLPSDGSISYLDQLVFDPWRFARIGLSLVKAMGGFVENGYSSVADALLYGCLLVLAVRGYVARLRRQITVYELFTACNFMLLTVWPAAESDRRFLLPILPLFFLYVGEGLCRCQSTILRRAEQPAAAVLTLAVLVSYLGCYTRLDLGPVRDGVSTPEAAALFGWIQNKTDRDAIFLFQKPKALALYTRRSALAHHKPADDAHLWRFLRSTGVTYVIVCPSSSCTVFQSSRRMLEPFIERHSDSFEEVYANPGFRVYRLRGTVLASH
jgi:hypothetical protein